MAEENDVVKRVSNLVTFREPNRKSNYDIILEFMLGLRVRARSERKRKKKHRIIVVRHRQGLHS